MSRAKKARKIRSSPNKISTPVLNKGTKTRKKVLTPVRRSRRLKEKDQIDPGQRSPGRRCSPLHRVSFPSRSVLKLERHSERSVGFLRPGFYSADDLETFLELRSTSVQDSPTKDESINEREENHEENHKIGNNPYKKENKNTSQGLSFPEADSSPLQLLAARCPMSEKKTVMWSDKLEW